MLTRIQIGTSIYAVLELNTENVVFDNVSIMMINNNQNNDIGLAPISFEGMNGTYTKMMFDVTGKVTLREYITKNISQNDFKSMLTSLIDTLENLDEYMIDSQQILLSLDTVFINTLDYKVSFLCVALKGKVQNGDVHLFFREVVGGSFVSSGEINYFNSVYNVVRSENGFSLQNIRKAMAGDNNTVSSKQVSLQKNPVTASNSANAVSLSKNEEPDVVTVSNAKVQPVQPETSQSTETEPKKKGLFGLFSSSKSSKKKKSETNSNSFKGGLAVLNNNSNSENIIPDKTEKSQNNDVVPVTLTGIQQDFGGTTVLSGGMANKVNQMNTTNFASHVNTVNQINPSDSINQTVPPTVGTTVLRKNTESTIIGSPGTTVLNPQNSGIYGPGTTVLKKPANKTASLIRVNTHERFFVNKPKIVIGRDMNGLDCNIHDNTAVGHEHAYIITRGGEYFIIDNNSTNHTYVNKIMLLGSEEKRISDGDKILIADEEFEFRVI